MRFFLRFGLPICLSAVLPAAVLAQAGFLPSQSPYHEITQGSYLEATAGHVFGGGGLLDLGPRDGTSEGLRYILRGKNTLEFLFGGWTAGLHRSVIDANDSVATRNKGLFNQRLIAGEIGIQLNLSGGKTWHALAPYTGISFGLVHGQSGPATDTSGYSFGNTLFFAPGVGTRLFLGHRAYVKLDVRALVWKLGYPPSYALEPSQQPGTTTAPNAVNPTGVTGEYTITPEIRFGLGISW